jgi:single-strand DNA-binding protein
MSNGVNRVFLLGNLGADPELRMSNSGSSVLKLRVATSEKYYDANKQLQERVEWHSVVVFGKRADGLAKFLSKGHRVHVEGSLATREYEDRDGNKRYITQVVARDITPLSSGGGGMRSDGGQRQERPQRAVEHAGGPYDRGFKGGADDDIPF